MNTPLLPPDESAAEAFWVRYLGSVGERPGDLPVVCERFEVVYVEE